MIAGIANHKNMCFVCEKSIVQNFGEARALIDATPLIVVSANLDEIKRNNI